MARAGVEKNLLIKSEGLRKNGDCEDEVSQSARPEDDHAFVHETGKIEANRLVRPLNRGPAMALDEGTDGGDVMPGLVLYGVFAKKRFQDRRSRFV